MYFAKIIFFQDADFVAEQIRNPVTRPEKVVTKKPEVVVVYKPEAEKEEDGEDFSQEGGRLKILTNISTNTI